MLLDGARTDVQLRPNLFITASLYQQVQHLLIATRDLDLFQIQHVRSPSFREILKLAFLWSQSKEARLSPNLRCSAHRRSSTCDCLYFTPEAWKRKAKEVLRTSPLRDKLCHNEKRGREKVHGEENAGSQPLLHQNFLNMPASLEACAGALVRARCTFGPFLLLVAAFSCSLLAQDELIAVPNRPTVSTTAQPVAPGVLETEWGVDAAATHQDINGLLKFGVSENFELRLANIPIIADFGGHGFGDTSLGFKYRFAQDAGVKPALAFIYMLKAPTARDGLGSGKVDHSIALLASKDIGKHHFDFNLIASLLRLPQGGFDHTYLNALAWFHPVHGKWGATAELSGITSPDPAIPGNAQFLASAVYAVRPRLVLDFGVIGRITGNIPDAMFIAGFSYSITDLYRRHSTLGEANFRQR
jgi:hypothetical protein